MAVELTARERIVAYLKEVGEASRTEIQRAVGGNPGVVRKHLAQMTASGEVVVRREERNHGTAKLHRLARPA